MKRLLALLLAMIMLASLLVACGSPDEIGSPDEPGATDTPGSTDQPGEGTEQPGGEPGDDVPTTPQREQYELVTAEGHDDGPYLVKTVYATEEAVIADIIVTPEAYGVDPTGKEDSTKGIQKALDDCRTRGGGTVFLPVGHYLVTKTISLSEGVFLQGDWQDPDLTDDPAYGTVILAKVPALVGEEAFDLTAAPLFKMLSENSSNNGLCGLTVFYPEQDVKAVKPYGYTVYAPNPGMTVLKNLTFLNSYQGIGACLGIGSHELLQIQGVHMTALATGYQVKNSNEVGYTYDLNISPKYWSEAAEPFRCSDAEALRTWCRENTTAMKFASLDLNQYTGIRIEGAYTAMLIDTGFWGVFHDVEIKDSVYGIVAKAITGASGVGISHATIEADKYAVVNYAVNGKPIKLTDVKVTGKGGIHTVDGAYTMLDNSADLSGYSSAYGTYKKPADFLYIADVTAFNQKHEDAAPAIQAALDAAAKTGGVVYVPHGIYNIYSALTVPAGVELRGAIPVAARDKYNTSGLIPGTVFLSYLEDGDLITLSESAGVQGIRIFYVPYDATTALTYLEANDARVTSCVAIRGKGANVYAVNVVISGGFVGIDFTDCDNHLVKDVYGCTFKNFIRAGGKNGNISAVLCNMTYTMRQPFFLRNYYDMDYCIKENWAIHSVEGNATGKATIRDVVLRQYCDTLYIADAEGETLNNVFMYGGHSLLIADNAKIVGINATTDWQGICPMFVFENKSEGIFFNPVRTSGSSHLCDDTSSLSLYNRLFNIYPNEPSYHTSSGYDETMGGEPVNELRLLNCDSTDGVQNAVLNTDSTYVKQGKGSLKHDGAVPEKWLTATFDPVDTAELGDEQMYLHLWLWVDNPHHLQWSGQITIGTAKGSYWNWGTTQTLTQEGWNEVLLPIPRKGETAPVFTSLSIQVDHSALGQYPTVYIDDISVCTVLPYAESMMQETTDELDSYVEKNPAFKDEPSRVMINDCDSLDGLTEKVIGITQFNTDPKYVKEGRGSLRVSVGPQVFYEQIIPTTDIRDFANVGYLHMWIYVENANAFISSGQIELTSSGTCDIGEKAWDVRTIKNDGWNELYLPIKDAKPLGTPAFDAKNVNYLRMFVNVPQKMTIYIDDIYICNVPGAEYDESNTIEAGNAATMKSGLPLLHDCDSDIGITKATLNTNPSYIKEGSGSLKAPELGADKLVFGFPKAQDITEYMDGYLHFSVYVADASKLTWGQFELTSSGTCDKEELGWLVPDYIKYNGWNEIYLPLATASKNGTFNPKNCNFIRVYVQWAGGGESPLMYFDDIRLVTKEEFATIEVPTGGTEVILPSEDEPEDDEGPVATKSTMLLDGETLVAGLAGMSVSADQVKEGKTSLMSNTTEEMRLLYRFDPIDFSAYKNGYLHIWIYVTDYEKIKDGQIELTSSNIWDKEEHSWSLLNHVKGNGWNELWLSLGSPDNRKECDLSRVNFLRIYSRYHEKPTEPAKMYFDDIYFSPTK